MEKDEFPVLLDHAGAWRVYLGGSRIRSLRGGYGAADNHYPEEWIASTVEASGAGAVPGAGLSRLRGEGAPTLRELIAASPEAWLGRDFCRRHGHDCGVLLKLLDAAERLNVQVHPTRADAKRLWGLPFGKAECWHFLEGRAGQPPSFYLGLREEVTEPVLRAAFDSGEPQRVLDCMHRFPAVPGQTVLVDGGVPHAIGAGCFLLEIQEPSDLTLRLEKRTASGTQVPDRLCHMGIGYDAMFSLIRYPGLSRSATRAAWFVPPRVLEDGPAGTVTQLLGYDRCPYFSLERILAAADLTLDARPAFYGLFVLSGSGTLLCGGREIPLAPGDQLFVPGGCPAVVLKPESPLCLIRFFGPRRYPPGADCPAAGPHKRH